MALLEGGGGPGGSTKCHMNFFAFLSIVLKLYDCSLCHLVGEIDPRWPWGNKWMIIYFHWKSFLVFFWSTNHETGNCWTSAPSEFDFEPNIRLDFQKIRIFNSWKSKNQLACVDMTFTHAFTAFHCDYQIITLFSELWMIPR